MTLISNPIMFPIFGGSKRHDPNIDGPTTPDPDCPHNLDLVNIYISFWHLAMDEKSTEEGRKQNCTMSPGLPLVAADKIDHDKQRYPHCIVWTPIPMLTSVFQARVPFIL